MIWRSLIGYFSRPFTNTRISLIPLEKISKLVKKNLEIIIWKLPKKSLSTFLFTNKLMYLIRIGCGTGNNPTRVPCWINFKISPSSDICLSKQIFSTCGTKTCNNLIIVWRGNLDFHPEAQEQFGCQLLISSSDDSTKF